METGTVLVNGLEINCIIGCLEHERVTPQKIAVDIEVDYDIEPAALSDNIKLALDYREIAQGLTEICQERKFQLVERMAHESCDFIMTQWPQVQRVKLAVRKLQVVPSTVATGLILERTR